MGTARNARRPQDYTALGIARHPIARREDGMRTTGEKDTYEWWYFDSHLDDGSSLVVVFYTKPFIEGVGKGLAPYVSVELDRPDGTHHQWEARADAAGFHAAADRCDVAIGPNTFRNIEWGEHSKYRIHVEEGPLLLDIDLVGQVPAWRPGTDGAIVADDPDKVRFSLEGEQVDEHSGKPFAQVVVYEYEDGADRYVIRYQRQSTIVDERMIDRLTGAKHLLAKVARFEGAYLRFTGQVELEHLVDGQSLEKVADPGIWELMWFGHVR
jgi:hypothetical protein